MCRCAMTFLRDSSSGFRKNRKTIPYATTVCHTVMQKHDSKLKLVTRFLTVSPNGHFDISYCFPEIVVYVLGVFLTVSDFIMGVYCTECSQLEWVTSSLEWRAAEK